MSTPTGNQRISWGVSIGLWPGAPRDPHFLPGGIGPRWLPFTLDFTAAGSNGAPISDSVTLDMLRGEIGSIQTIFIDNSANSANPFVFLVGGTGHRLSVPKNTMAFLPLACTTEFQFTATATGTVLVPIAFVNMPMAPIVWTAS